ncbi:MULTISPECIES: hypothetical protein [Clostridium]|nr:MULTISPECIES: hypothetical protein [Clostridium]CAG7839418.1 hypothetical protein CLOHAE12215_00831 [Clostridium haemolyticum]
MKKRNIIASIAAIGMIVSLFVSSKEKENKKENKNNTEKVYE